MSVKPTHNKSISIAKGIGILLMVIGHSGAPYALTHWLYSFHMPLFFFISGYLFKDTYLEDKESATKYVRNKIKGLYIPFVKWVIIFALLHNLLAYLHINPTFYSFRGMVTHIYKAFFLIYDEGMVGGFWFIRTLFVVSIFAYLLIWGIEKLTHSNPKYLTRILVQGYLYLILAILLTIPA